MKAPTPLTNAFLVCRRIVDEPGGEDALIGLTNSFVARAFPAAVNAGLPTDAPGDAGFWG